MINYNGKYFDEGTPILLNDDHSYRYGDGLFETMKVVNSDILLKDYHFERLFSGLKILRFSVPPLFTAEKIESEIKELCKRNKCERLARVRLSVSRGGGGLYDSDNKFSYLIESRPLEQKGFNEKGLIIDIFPEARKSTDVFSNLKSANYLPYIMAAVWAKENKFNDALILNSGERVCDATIANVFWAKDNKTFTPPLSEGCVAGVMRRRILEINKAIHQETLTVETLINADEVFLTNVTSGIRWVEQCANKKYANKISGKLFAELSQTIHA